MISEVKTLLIMREAAGRTAPDTALSAHRPCILSAYLLCTLTGQCLQEDQGLRRYILQVQ